VRPGRGETGQDPPCKISILNRVVTVIGRLKILANDIDKKTLSTEARTRMLRDRRAEVRATITGLRDLERNLAAKLPRYEAKFEEIAAQE
jgi:hypothetical protein